MLQKLLSKNVSNYLVSSKGYISWFLLYYVLKSFLSRCHSWANYLTLSDVFGPRINNVYLGPSTSFGSLDSKIFFPFLVLAVLGVVSSWSDIKKN